MKLRLQVASLLPATTKVGSADVNGKSAFGTTMQQMMGTIPSGKASAAGISQGSSVMQARLQKNPEIGNAGEASAVPSAEGGAIVVVPKEVQVTRSSGIQPPVTDETSAAQMAQGTMDAKPGEQLLMLPQQLQFIAGRGEQPRESPAGTEPSLAPLSKDAFVHARHKAGGEDDGGNHPGVDGSPYELALLPQPISLDVAPVLSPISIAVPVASAEPAGSKAAPLKANSEADRGHMRAQDVLRRVPVQPVTANHGELKGAPLATPASPAQAQARIIAPAASNKVSEPTSSDTNMEHSLHAHLVPATDGKANAGASAQPNQNQHPQAAASEFVANTKQIDGRAQKQSEGRIGSEQEPASIGSVLHHPTATSFTMQHQAESNIPPAVIHGTQKGIENQRPLATAAQVLQKMDTGASSGAVQLRADARRLDVGISSGALGWVEIRATTAASGRVDAALHVQNNSSGYALASQSREISDYAREHSVPLGELSVGVGTGDSAREESRNPHNDGRSGNGRQAGETIRPPAHEHTYTPADTVSFISIRA